MHLSINKYILSIHLSIYILFLSIYLHIYKSLSCLSLWGGGDDRLGDTVWLAGQDKTIYIYSAADPDKGRELGTHTLTQPIKRSIDGSMHSLYHVKKINTYVIKGRGIGLEVWALLTFGWPFHLVSKWRKSFSFTDIKFHVKGRIYLESEPVLVKYSCRAVWVGLYTGDVHVYTRGRSIKLPAWFH